MDQPVGRNMLKNVKTESGRKIRGTDRFIREDDPHCNHEVEGHCYNRATEPLLLALGAF